MFLSDGGASISVVETPDVLTDVRKADPGRHKVRDANGNVKSATHVGTLILQKIIMRRGNIFSR